MVLDVDEAPDALSPPTVDGGVLVEAVAVSERLLVRAAPGVPVVGGTAAGSAAGGVAIGFVAVPLSTII